VARRALAVVASLASADAAAWRQIKRMASAVDPLLSGRIGIHHRVLFRVADGELAVLSVVHRKDLESAIRRYGRR
jgi:Txe/YoeB family toxin of Txe-Axe toxin-antitoxin module